MKIGFSITALHRSLSKGELDGIGVYSEELLDLFKKKNTEHEFYNFVFGNYKSENNNDLINAKNVLDFKIIFLASVFYKKKLNYNFFNNIDIFHSLDHYIPKLKIPVIATLHDIIPFRYPSWLTYKSRYLRLPFFKKTIYWADHLVTVSEYSKNNICEFFKIPEQNVSVVYNFLSEKWREPLDYGHLEILKKNLSLKKEYIIFYGTNQPRKNIIRIIKAYLSLDKTTRDNYDLVIAGSSGWKSQDVDFYIDKYKSIKRIKFLNNNDFIKLIKGSSLIVFPSLAEGFGYPILEGFSSNVPVITSQISSMREIAAYGAHLVDPYDIYSISDGINKILKDDEYKKYLIANGRKRLNFFSREKSYSSLIKVYEKFK